MVAAIMGFSTSSKYDEGGGGGCFARILGGGTRFRAMIFFYAAGTFASQSDRRVGVDGIPI